MAGIGSRGYRVRDWIVKQVAQGHLRAGDRLPTEGELAALLQVSPITVRRALSHLASEGWLIRRRRAGTFLSQLPPELQQPERAAIALLTSKLMGDQLGDFYLGSLYAGIQQGVQQTGGSIIWLDYEACQKRDLVNSSRGAIAVAPPLYLLPWLRELQRQMPIVVLGADTRPWGIACVDSDNRQAMRQAINHLIEQGHRRFIGVFADQYALNTQDRMRTFLMELARHNIPESAAFLLLSQDTFHLDPHVNDAVQGLLSLPKHERPTAVVGGGYYLAMAALQLANRMRLDVPRQLSIVGFDDPPSAALTVPPMTTLQQPLYQMGVEASELLQSLLDKRQGVACYRYLPMELIIRQTTASPENGRGDP
jgi:DNA-binding LacI/PurR family transcriptional regulator